MIEIGSRLRPFSHQPGIRCLLPRSGGVVRCYPTRLILPSREIYLPYEGRVEGFTVVQDLERDCVTVFHRHMTCHILPDEQVIFGKHPHSLTFQGPRYDFGASKKLEMESLRKRCDVREMIPLWIRLGQGFSLPAIPLDSQGCFSLLAKLQELVACKHHDALFPLLRDLFLVGFEGMMVPRAEDTDFQGIIPKEIGPSINDPLYLLQEGASCLRSLFLHTEGNHVTLLPHLPSPLVSGRIVRERFGCGEISLAWQKKMIRQVEIYPSQSGEIHLHFPSSVRSYRIRARGERAAQRMDSMSPLVLSQGIPYLLDQFVS